VNPMRAAGGGIVAIVTFERDCSGAGVNPESLAAAWHAQIGEILRVAGLETPAAGYMQRGGREGRHTEHLGHLLSEMQILARSHPGAEW